MNLESDIELGEKYEDPQTGVKGTATSIHFYQYACERVTIETMMTSGELKEYTFDAPRLVHIDSGKRAKTARTGGPGSPVAEARPGAPAR